ncbi:MAG: DeoR/GlpR family DNA-binding transcription regulator [Sciscionella sp.]
MYPDERQRDILAEVRAHGRVDVVTLAGALKVTPETIRRDLAVLARQGGIRRVYGGAVLARTHAFEPALARRNEQLGTEKERIAQFALKELPESGVLVLDSGSTTEAIARALPTDRELTVVTNALPIATLLAANPAVEVWCTGGRLRKQTLAVVDEWARQMLSSITADVAFIGADGISATKGLTTVKPLEAAVKSTMIAAARHRVVVTDHSKIGRDAFCRFAELSEIDLVITDSEVEDDLADELEALGPRVVRA